MERAQARGYVDALTEGYQDLLDDDLRDGVLAAVELVPEPDSWAVARPDQRHLLLMLAARQLFYLEVPPRTRRRPGR